jgi:phage I-like protein
MNSIAICATQTTLSGPTEAFRIIPGGEFRAQDGRPKDAPAWKMDEANANRLIAAANQRQDDYLIDFEHASLSAKDPTPAAGWFKQLEWKPEQGLFAAGARWTDKAKAMLKAGEYRYVSPVFSYDASGAIVDLVSVALTNTPALAGLTDLSHLAINSLKQSMQSQQDPLAADTAPLTDRQRDYFKRVFGFEPKS